MVDHLFSLRSLGLVAVQALARTEDRAVATSTRKLLRSLGSVFGVAISTAVQRATMQSALRSGAHSATQSRISSDGRDLTHENSGIDPSQILDAKMAGFRMVFISLVPFISLCFVGNFLVQDVTLNDSDIKTEKVSIGVFNILRFRLLLYGNGSPTNSY